MGMEKMSMCVPSNEKEGRGFLTNRELLSSMVPLLLEWYDQNKRKLPWRENTDPYRVWVSEIMLQQTRVDTVIPYYTRFLQECPDLLTLAHISEEQLLKLWEGLGYYNRVRNMQKAAQKIQSEYGGQFPGEFERLKSLPGFGEYTAGAVGSIAFQLRVPAVDGNVLRVISRIVENKEDIAKPVVKKEISAAIQAVLPERVGDFNQSLMELGAVVCLPNGDPCCTVCPVKTLCRAYAEGSVHDIPVKAAKPDRRIEERTVFILISQGKTLLRKRKSQGLLAGLWEFPSVERKLKVSEAKEFLQQEGISFTKVQTFKSAKHIFSHIEWRMSGYLVHLKEEWKEADGVWADASQLEKEYAVPSAFKSFYQDCIRILKNNQ